MLEWLVKFFKFGWKTSINIISWHITLKCIDFLQKVNAKNSTPNESGRVIMQNNTVIKNRGSYLNSQWPVINSKATHLRIKSCFLKTQMINVRYYLSTLRYESYRCKIFQALNFICFKEFFFKKNDYFPCGFSPNQSLNSAVKSIGPGDHTSSHQKRRFN